MRLTKKQINEVKTAYADFGKIAKAFLVKADCPTVLESAITPTVKIKLSSFFKDMSNKIRDGHRVGIAFYNDLGSVSDATKIETNSPLTLSTASDQGDLNKAADLVNESAILFGNIYPVYETEDDHYLNQ